MTNMVKLSDVAELTVGYVGTMGKEYSEEGVIFLRSLNIKPYTFDLSDIKYVSEEFNQKISKSVLHTNDVVIVRTGLPGTSAVVTKDLDGCNCSDLVIVHPDFSKIDPHYLCAFLNSWGKVQVQNAKVGAVQKHFNVTSAQEMLIPLPDLEMQKDIADVIYALNEKIENNNSICSDLEGMAKLLYDYWFVQFDFPDENGKPYKSSGGKMVWNDELKREIPEGWKVCPSLELFDWIGTSQPPKSSFVYEPKEGYIRFIQNRDYDGDNHVTYIPYTSATRVCDEKDIMVDKYGDAGRTRFGIAGAYNVALSKIHVHDDLMKEYIRA